MFNKGGGEEAAHVKQKFPILEFCDTPQHYPVLRCVVGMLCILLWISYLVNFKMQIISITDPLSIFIPPNHFLVYFDKFYSFKLFIEEEENLGVK